MYRVRITVAIAALVWMADPLPALAQGLDDPCDKNHYILNAKCDDGLGEAIPTPAVAAKSAIALPAAIAADAAGNVYIGSGNAIYKVDANGLLTRFAGNGVTGYAGDGGPAELAEIGIAAPGVPGPIVEPDGEVQRSFLDGGYDGSFTTMASGIAIDHQGDLYIADTLNNRVRKVDVHGVITTVAGNGDASRLQVGNDALDVPVPVDTHSGLPILPSNGATGRDDRETDGGPAIDAQISSPYAIGVDSAGDLYVLNFYGLLRKVAPDGLISTIARLQCQPGFGGAGVCATGQIAVDDVGNVFIGDSYCRVRQLTSEGTLLTVAGDDAALSTRSILEAMSFRCRYSGDGGRATAAGLGAPGSVARDAAGSLYIADAVYNCIRKVDAAGAIRTIAGSCRGSWQYDGVLLNSPQGVAVDPAGIIYIADTGNGRILKVTPDGMISTIAGTMPGLEGQP
ncbi:MAG TPA: hypothetical protein VGR63_10780 [Casimicrobiaceae bacterium]|nr:hypothetical protein [Casimicrobiaceae bacterium]